MQANLLSPLAKVAPSHRSTTKDQDMRHPKIVEQTSYCSLLRVEDLE